MSANQPLHGIKVVEICHSIAGPYGGVILAELGADVVKVENPDRGDDARAWGPPYWHGTSTIFQAMNRDKRGITADLKDPAELERLRRLIVDEADVVLQSLRPGAIDRLGLSGEELLRAKPTLIYCNIGAFGKVGPLRERPGYDPLMQARSGLMSVTGEEGREPVRIGTSIIDMGSGMWAAIGILAALARRSATGKGCIVDTSLFETSIAWMSVHVPGYLASGEVRKRMGSAAVEIVPHQAFRTADGFVMVAAANDALFGKLAAAMEHAEWREDARYANNGSRVCNRHLLVPLLQGVFETRPTAHWLAVLDAAGVPCSLLQSVGELVADPQARAVGMIQKAPDLDMELVGLPLSFDGERPPYRRSGPRIGEHNADVFGEHNAEILGKSEDPAGGKDE